MFKWKDRKYVNARKKIFKNLDTGEILNLEVQDDEDNISEESDTPLTAHCLNMAQDELVDDMSKTYTGTNITAPTVAGVGRVNKVKGFCRQETREGRNLYNYADAIIISEGVTVDDDGWITITCDNTNGTTKKYLNYFTNNLNLETDTNYNIIAEVKNVSGTGAIHFISAVPTEKQFETGSYKLFSNVANNNVYNSINKTLTTALGNYGLRTFAVYEIGQSGSITFRLSVLKDTTITPEIFKYESYGASPSSKFPAKIHCLGDDVNLFGATKNDFENGETLGAAKKVVFNLKPNTQYTCSSNDDIGTVSGANIWFNGNDSTLNGVFKNHSRTVVTDENGKLFIAIRTTQIEKFFDGTYYIKLQEGTVATPYSPFGCGTIINKSRNKNLASTEIIKSLNKPVFTNITSNGFTLDVSQGIVSGLNLIDIMFGELDGSKQYTLSYHLSQNNTTFNPRLAFYYTDGTTSLPPVNSNSEVDVSFSSVVGKTIERISLIWSTAATGSLAKFSKIQLEKGDKSDYVPHKEDIRVTYIKEPLCGVNDVYDEQDLSKGEIERNFAKKVLDGTETWHTGQDMGEVMRFYSSSLNLSKSVSFGISNYFKWLKHYTDNSEHFYIGSDGYLYIFIDKETCPDTASFKVWLSEHPVEIIYPLDEPNIESIDCTDKIAQFDGQTTIYNVDGAEIECTLTNNRAIAETNENLDRVEQDINTIEQNTKLENMNKNIRGHFEFIENSDANKLTKVGLYRLTGTLTNYPSTSSGILEINGSEDIAIEQIFTQHNGKKWNRICWYGTWSSWLTMN